MRNFTLIRIKIFYIQKSKHFSKKLSTSLSLIPNVKKLRVTCQMFLSLRVHHFHSYFKAKFARSIKNYAKLTFIFVNLAT